MSSYLQMGHHTENLVGEEDLGLFSGIILSPLNRKSEELFEDVKIFRKKRNYDIIFDTQLYFPRGRRQNLQDKPYFPSDIDTADMSSPAWWSKIISKLSSFVAKLGVDGVASPVVSPRSWSNEYFSICADVSGKLAKALERYDIRVLATAMVDVNRLVAENAIYEIASILSSADGISGYYVVLCSEVDPRREFSDNEVLVGVMMLIRELQNTGLPVLMSHCSSDMILFKAAGAAHCSSGKFFNLRRFTKGRYEEPAGGGGQLPYWFEHSLLAFLREADLFRLKNEGQEDLIGNLWSDNYWAKEIWKHFERNPGQPWLGLSWRQYLGWFSKAEKALSGKDAQALSKEWLKNAERNWTKLDDEDILFDETRNNGAWIRPWRQALSTFLKKS